jgi:urease subunit alpha
MDRVMLGMDGWPVNLGLQAGARAEDDGAFDALLEAGACGFKIHEDYGAYPELIDRVLRYAEAHDVSVSLHTDGLHEAAELEDTVAAIAGRTVHAYHVEGTGGGHVPDLLGLVRVANILCSSTTPTVPFGVNAAAEGAPMIILNHGASFAVGSDVALVAERVHPATMAAEGPLHELGAIGIVNSDSQGMGRIMETLRRSIQLADAMRAWRGTDAGQGHPGLPDEPEDPSDATERVLRYLAKATIEPAITHGLSAHVGSLAPGRLADVVLWKPAYFGVKPELVIKAGFRAWAPLGEGNSTVKRAEPTRFAADWGGTGRAGAAASLTFVSELGAADPRLVERLAAGGRTVVPVRGTRGLTRSDLVWNRATAPIEIDLADGRVTLAGRPLASEPVVEVPLNRRYWLR